MKVLYLDEYKRAMKGKNIFIACREGILRDHFIEIINDIKFLNRQDINTFFFHNISKKLANHRILKEIELKLFQSNIVRIPSDTNFYEAVLKYSTNVFKIVFIERSCLLDKHKNKINTLTTHKMRKNLNFHDVISNVNFNNIFDIICYKIEQNENLRVHILPAVKNAIKHELFSIEGSGTMIANNFHEKFSNKINQQEIRIIVNILKSYKYQGFLKPRSKEYIKSNIDNFYVAKIDDVIVGCAEKLEINSECIELGSLAVSTKFRSQQIGFFIINSFINEMKNYCVKQIVSLTNNPKLQSIFLSLGFKQKCPKELCQRQERSPNIKMFIKNINY